MREKLETLPLTQLRELAKSQGVKSVTTLRKAEVIDKLCELADLNGGETELVPQTEQRTSRGYAERVRESSEPAGRSTAERYSRGSSQAAGSRYSSDAGSRGSTDTGSRYSSDAGSRGSTDTGSRYSSDAGSRGSTDTGSRYSSDAGSRGSTDTGSRYSSDAGSRSNQDRRSDYSRREDTPNQVKTDFQELDSGVEANGILEVMPDGFGFIRCQNFLPGEDDVYVAPSQIRRFNLKTGDIVQGSRRVRSATEKFAALLYINTINGYPANVVERRPNFENLTPIFPDQRLRLEVPGVQNTTAMRIVDLLSPIGKGQRGMIVSPPKAGKTTLLKQIARAVTAGNPDMHLIILLIDERPEEVTDIKEAIVGPEVEVIYSTFDELPERHKRVSEMVIERAKRLVEHGRDVAILLDSITRLTRAYNLVVPPSGRTLSGGLDPAALHMPKRFFGAARNIREGGSLTILATALINTGSRMDDVIYEEFKGTGNMELVLDRKLQEKRIFPAIDILKSGTRRDDLLLTPDEAEVVDMIHKATNNQKPEESVERILDLFARTRNNQEFVDATRKRRYF